MNRLFLNSNLETSKPLTWYTYRILSIIHMDSLRNKIERWLTHETFAFREISDKENSFHFVIKHAGESGIPVDVFESSSQPGVLVIGCKASMKNSQIVRYLNLSDSEKKSFENKI